MLSDELLHLLHVLRQGLLIPQVQGLLGRGDPVQQSLHLLSLGLRRGQAGLDPLPLLLGPRLDLRQRVNKLLTVRPFFIL